MKPLASTRQLAIVGTLCLALGSPAAGQQQDSSTELEAFGALVVGQWDADGSRHEFTWGVGRRVVRSQSWFGDGDEWTLVSEGWWYWDPVEETIRGQTVAENMGIDLFEHRSRVEGRVIVSGLVSHGDFGGVYVERWTFDDRGYDWVLEQDDQPVMAARYTRTR